MGGLRDLRSHQPVAISHELTLAHEGERQRRAAVFHNPEDRPMIIDLGIAMRVLAASNDRRRVFGG